jgi:hypothetical protein
LHFVARVVSVRECAVVVKNVFLKTLFSFAAFSAGIVWGIAAEASAAGLPLIGVFQG